jgi:AcrR family transcriptional regulator
MSPRAGLDTQAVVQAAAELVDAEGLQALNISRLAKTLGVQPPSLYNHVLGLPGLRRDLALFGLDVLYEQLTRAVVGKSGARAVRALAEAYRDFIRAHPGVYEATVRSPYLEEILDPQLEAASREVVDLVLVVLVAYDLDEEAALHAVRGLRSLVHGFATLENAGGFGLDLDTETSFQYLLEVYLRGLPVYTVGKSGE